MRRTRTTGMPNTSARSSTASPSSFSSRATSSWWRASSACGSGATSSVDSASTAASGAGSGVSVPLTSLNDDRLPAPTLLELVVADALVLDALLQQHDALDEGLGPRRAAGDVHVDGHDLVDALGDRVRVPVGAAAVGARTHGDHVLGVGHLVVEPTDGRGHLVGDGTRDADEV